VFSLSPIRGRGIKDARAWLGSRFQRFFTVPPSHLERLFVPDTVEKLDLWSPSGPDSASAFW
jgi:hypothetical protein